MMVGWRREGHWMVVGEPSGGGWLEMEGWGEVDSQFPLFEDVASDDTTGRVAPTLKRTNPPPPHT